MHALELPTQYAIATETARQTILTVQIELLHLFAERIEIEPEPQS